MGQPVHRRLAGVTETEYKHVVMDSRGSPSLRGIAGWDEVMAAKQRAGWEVDSITSDDEQVVVRFRRSLRDV